VGTLKKLLTDHRKEILTISEQKIRALAGGLGTSRKLQRGPPLFHTQLIKFLNKKYDVTPPTAMRLDAAASGKECLRLGYSLSHVVHSYGAVCQAITEVATRDNWRFTPNEFNALNKCLDVAISCAVSEYHFQSNQEIEVREVKNLGFLAHELRNALSSATIAHEMLKAGLVGIGGSTSGVLEENLARMRNLIDRSLSEVRMRSDAELQIDKFSLVGLLDQVLITARFDAAKKNQTLLAELKQKIQLVGDRQILISAVANLIQNAIKYSPPSAKIWVRAKSSGKKAFIEVEDECGGINPKKIDSLFEPYTQERSDRSGLGLGLTIVHRAVALSQGKISVQNNPGKGCTFVIEIPLKIRPERSKKVSVGGVDSVQPRFPKRK